MLLPLYGMEAYISCLSGGANQAEITEYHVLSGLFLAADITAQQGEVLAINRCPYFHFGREKYLWGTDLHEVGHDPMYGGHFAQVDNGIKIIGAEALPSSVHVAFAAAKSVEETGATAAFVYFFMLIVTAARCIGYLFAYALMVVGAQVKAFSRPLRRKGVRSAIWSLLRQTVSCITWRYSRFGAVRCVADVNRMFFGGEGQHDFFLGIVNGLAGLHCSTRANGLYPFVRMYRISLLIRLLKLSGCLFSMGVQPTSARAMMRGYIIYSAVLCSGQIFSPYIALHAEHVFADITSQ